MINEILQWIVLIWCIWAINNLGSAIKSHNDIFIQSSKDRLDKLLPNLQEVTDEGNETTKNVKEEKTHEK